MYRERIRAIVAHYGGVNPRVFGSVARGEDTEDSDLDILVDDPEGHRLDLFALGQVIGARNVIIHGYAEIEPDRIWDIVKNHPPASRVAVGRLQQLLNEKEPDRREDLGR